MKKLFFFFLPNVCCLLSILSHSQTWNKVGTGVCCGTTALGIYNNELYFGGGYSWPTPYINIAKWNGSVWTPVDSAVGYPYCFLEYNNELYMGGNFNNIQGAGLRIAKWTGIQWVSLGSGANGSSINDLAVFNGEVYAAGSFTSIGGVFTYGIARWNGTNWSAVSGGLSGGIGATEAYALVFNNDLYVGGDFTMAGNVPAAFIARWNGVKWDSLRAGVDLWVNGMAVDTINNFLYIVGNFNYIGNKYAYTVARWDGFELDSVANTPRLGYAKTCAEMYHGQLYVGGYAGYGGPGDTVLITWDGKQWQQVIGPDGTVEHLQVYKDELYVGGSFYMVGNDSVMGLARYSAPWDSSCKFFQPIIKSMLSLSAPHGLADTFYYTDSAAVQFYNNITSASSWLWNFGDGDTGSGKTPAHYYNTAGTYTVSVVVNYPWGPYGPCIDTAYKIITVINNTGVNDPETSSGLRFKVYPNPAKKEITVELPEARSQKPEGKYIVRIKNSLGQEIFQQSFPSTFQHSNIPSMRIDTSPFQKGLYVVEVCTSEGVVCHTEKVVVE